jgi:uncharacterized damage-inducible protein DinB
MGAGSAVAFKRALRALSTLERMNAQLQMPPLETLVAHTAWANRQLFAALGEVASFESQKGADLIVRLLDHVHVVGKVFQAHLQGASHSYTSTQSPVLPTLAELDRASELLDRWYVETAASLRPEELARPRYVRFTDGNVVTMTAATMLLHVVTHTAHHRGNVDALMYQAGMPRRRDGLPEFLVSRASAT